MTKTIIVPTPPLPQRMSVTATDSYNLVLRLIEAVQAGYNVVPVDGVLHLSHSFNAVELELEAA